MQLEIRPPQKWGVWEFLAIGAWSATLVFICIRVTVTPHTHSLYPTYATAGADWLAGIDTYYRPHEAYLDQYRYSPLITVSLIPWHWLPERLGGVLWRLLNAAILLAGWDWWLRVAAPLVLTARQRAVAFLLILPLSLASLNNGQPNSIMAGMLLIAFAAAARERWWICAASITVAVAIKAYPLAAGLLVVACYPLRLGPRLALCLLVAVVLPFCFQTPDYVFSQYQSWYKVVAEDDRKMWPFSIAYRDLWLLFRLVGAPLSPRVYLGLQVGLGLICAVVCFTACKLGWTRRPLLAIVSSLGACWMMLCGPATESCTYVLLAPALAWSLLGACYPRVSPWRLVAPASSSALLLAGVFAGLIANTSGIHGYGMQPLAALFLLIGTLAEVVTGAAAQDRSELARQSIAAPARAA